VASYRFGASLSAFAAWSVQFRKHMNVGIELLPLLKVQWHAVGCHLSLGFVITGHFRVAPDLDGSKRGVLTGICFRF
jgi:hypothetical protein